MESDLETLISELRNPRTRDEAWARLVPIVFRLAEEIGRKLRVSREEIEDVAADVSLRVVSNPRPMVSARDARAYLAVVLQNRFIDGLRRSKRRSQLARRMATPAHEGADRRRTEARLSLDVLLRSLSRPERELLAMRFGEGRSIGEIAGALGISYSAAGVRVFRLLKRLRRHVRRGRVKGKPGRV